VTTDEGNRLELRTELIPRSGIIKAIEEEVGKRITHQRRHYLANQPVHCGDMLEMWMENRWVLARYEWSGKPDESPTVYHDGGVAILKDSSLLRWPVPNM
jgi:hypothetical protein